MHRRALSLLLLLPGFIAGPAVPAHGQCLDYASYAHWDGICPFPHTARWPERFGDFLVATTLVGTQPRTGIEVVDISDPARPRHVLHKEVPFDTTRTAVPGHIYLLPHNDIELWVVDVSDPLDPAVVGVVHNQTRRFIVYRHPWLYMSFRAGIRYHGLQVFNLADPRSPELRTEMLNPVPIERIVASGDVLLAQEQSSTVGSGRALRLFDISNPGSPVRMGEFVPANTIQDVECSGATAYVGLGAAGLVAVDVADPWALREVARLPVTADRLWIHDDRLLLRGGSTVAVADIAEPRSPVVLGVLPLPGEWREGGLVLGNRLILTTTARVAGADLDLMSAGVASPHARLDYASAGDVASNGRFAFTSKPNLDILDVSDPSAPAVVGQFSIAAVGEEVCVDQGLVYFTLGDLGLMIADADVADLSEPARRSWTVLGPTLKALDVDGPVAVIGTAQGNLLVVDVSLPEAPAIVSSTALPFVPARVSLGHGMAFVLGSDALQVVDVRDPAAPVLRGYLPTPTPVRGIRATVGRCWIAGDAGCVLVDAANVDDLHEDTIWPLEAPAHDVELSGRWALVAGGHPQVSILDTEQRTNPSVAGTCYFGATPARRIIASASVFLVATNSELAVVPGICEPTALFAQDLAAIPVDGGVLLSWTADAGDDRAGTVLRAIDPVAEPLPIGVEPVRSGSRWRCTDPDVAPDTMYWYRVSHPRNPLLRSDPVAVRTPSGRDRLELRAGTASPFRERIELRFAVPSAGRTRLAMYDVTGRLVRVLRDGELPAGLHSATWDGRDAGGRRTASGAYFAVLRAGRRDARVKIVLVH